MDKFRGVYTSVSVSWTFENDKSLLSKRFSGNSNRPREKWYARNRHFCCCTKPTRIPKRDTLSSEKSYGKFGAGNIFENTCKFRFFSNATPLKRNMSVRAHVWGLFFLNTSFRYYRVCYWVFFIRFDCTTDGDFQTVRAKLHLVIARNYIYVIDYYVQYRLVHYTGKDVYFVFWF